MSHFTATYFPASGHSYPATIFVSQVTITIRYKDEKGNAQDVNWLAENITVFDEKDAGTIIQYRLKEGVTEQLVITDPELLQAVKKNLRHHRLIGKTHNRLFNSMASKSLLLFAIIAGFIAMLFFWFVPWLGERAAGRFPKSDEISLGEKMYRSLEDSYAIDAGKTVVINEFYKELHYAVDYPIEITVVQSKELNAFAIPGGHIVVYDAMLERMNSAEELAALLGHEASHIAKRHSLRNLFRGLARKMFLSLLFGNESGISNVVINNADNLKGLQFSRALETEADNNGLQLMADSNIDLQGMVKLMELLQTGAGKNEPAAFLTTHPLFKQRIKNIKEQIAKLPQTTKKNEELVKLFQSLKLQW